MARITVFHTSALHNKLTTDNAAQLRSLKDSHPDSLMLDSGDAIWAGNIYWRHGGEPIHDLMNSVPYDAMCMGNREFHFLQSGIKAKLARAKFPIVSANLCKADTDGERFSSAQFTAGVLASMRFHINSIKIAILGLSVPCITEKMFVRKVSSTYFTDPIETANKIVPTLRSEYDLVIALTHIGLKRDIELAEQVEGIDVILGGHTHTITDPPERVGNTVILHSGHHARFVRKVEIELDAGKVSVNNELIPLKKA